MDKPIKPGKVLEDLVREHDYTKSYVAEQTGTTFQTLNEIINGNDTLIEKFVPRIKSVIADLAKNDLKDNKAILNLLDDLSNFKDKPTSLEIILKISSIKNSTK